jgi:hypothetical protein
MRKLPDRLFDILSADPVHHLRAMVLLDPASWCVIH